MITIFHAICIIARLMYRVLSESTLVPFPNKSLKVVDHLSCKGGKYQISAESFFEEGYGPKFFPPLYMQRYLLVKAVLEDENWKGSIRKVVDFGCAEFGFFTYLKAVRGVHEILEVDVNSQILENHCCKVSPLNSDYLCPRSEPLTVYVLEGSIAHTDKCLIGCDAVVCIELIEHLYPDVLEEVPFTVFSVIKPRVAVFTTPNGEFNVLFPNSSGFRHDDHKFEWTREQFKNWANNIIVRYPEYKVSFHGIGWGPNGTENVGTCSQMAVFERHQLDLRSNCSISGTIKDDRNEDVNHTYNVVRKIEFPFHVDTRSEREKFCEQAEYGIRLIATSQEFLEENSIEIPLFRLLPFVTKWTSSIKDIEDVLKEAGWELATQKSGCVVAIYQMYNSSSWSEDPEEEDVDYVEPFREDQEQHEVYNWNDIKNESEEMWDCDSLDLNVKTSACNYDSMLKQPNVSFVSEFAENEDDTNMPTSDFISTSAIDSFQNKSVCPSSTSDYSRQEFPGKLYTHDEICDVQNDCNKSDFQNADLSSPKSTECVNKSICDLHPKSNHMKHKTRDHKLEISEGCDKKLYNCNACASSSSSVLQMNGATESCSIPLAFSHKAASSQATEAHHLMQVPVPFLKSSSSNNLYLNLQAEAQGANIEGTVKKPDGLYDSPVAGSVSIEEPNDRLADSGYPNSTSAQDMDLDLTPEQVEELFTENDVVTDYQPDRLSDSVSVSSQDSDSVSDAQQLPQPLPVVIPQPDVLFEEAMNVENGDVANNNRDGEGNNVVAIGAHHNEGVADGDDNAIGIVLPENLGDLFPLFAAAEDLDNDNEIEINVVEPFPPWLLNLLGLANGGGGGVAFREDGENILHREVSDDEDSDNNPVIDEGLGDEYNLDSTSLSDSCPSDIEPESDIAEEIAAANL